MQIKFDFEIIIFVLFFFILRVEKIYLLFLIFSIVHEIFHMMAGIIVGFQPLKISIMPLGAYINFKIDIENYNKKILKGTYCSLKKILVAFAGPLSNIIMTGVFFIQDYYIIAYINITIGLFNLLPIFPLDGGRILKQILVLLIGRRKALKYINIISNIVLSIIIIIALAFCIATRSIFILLTLIYLIYIRKKENDIYVMKKRAYQILDVILTK